MWERTEKALTENRLEKAQEHIQKGKAACLARLKLIRIADRDGWDAANCYLTDDLASDTDDEKRISKAIRIANSNRH